MMLEDKKKEREKESLKKHARLCELFKKNRFAFELERKRMIDEIINSSDDEDQRNRLRAIQAAWDKRMKKAGSNHNRFVLAQTLFWRHFYETWWPEIQKCNSQLNGDSNYQE